MCFHTTVFLISPTFLLVSVLSDLPNDLILYIIPSHSFLNML